MAVSFSLTLPSGFADRLDINMHSHILLRSLLTAVKGRHHNLVALLLVIAQPLSVSDVTLKDTKTKEEIQLFIDRNRNCYACLTIIEQETLSSEQ